MVLVVVAYLASALYLLVLIVGFPLAIHTVRNRWFPAIGQGRASVE